MTLAQATGIALILLAAAAPHPSPGANPAASSRGAALHDARKASAAELGTLANSVERGAVRSTKALDRAFARAKHALQQSSSAGGRG